MKQLLKEFWPSLLFLGKFIGLYLVLNLAYGFYVNSYAPEPDPATITVARQTNFVINLLGSETTTRVQDSQVGVLISNVDRAIISVYEGCNGLNVAIVFISFLLAYGNLKRQLLWFIPLGLLILHLVNLVRIGLLYYVSLSFPDYLYFTHKYLFTGAIYLVVFILWGWWIMAYIRKNGK